jgi:transcriptional regulator with XRE-family HTH domain
MPRMCETTGSRPDWVLRNDPDLTAWGGWLRELRQRQQWTQRELAERLQTYQSTVGRWECCAARPGPKFRRALVDLGRDVGLVPPEPEP